MGTGVTRPWRWAAIGGAVLVVVFLAVGTVLMTLSLSERRAAEERRAVAAQSEAERLARVEAENEAAAATAWLCERAVRRWLSASSERAAVGELRSTTARLGDGFRVTLVSCPRNAFT